MLPNTYGGRIEQRLNDGGRLETLMHELIRDAEPLPESVERGQVRTLHQSQLFGLIRDVLKDQLGAWESQLQHLTHELKVAQQEKAVLETTRLHEIPRLAEMVDSEKSRADLLTEERSQLETRIGELEQALADRDRQLSAEELQQTQARNARLRVLEQTIEELESSRPEDLEQRLDQLQLSCERARAASRQAAMRSAALECELEALRGARIEGTEANESLDASNEDLRRELEARVAGGRALKDELETAQRAFQEVWSLSTEQEGRIAELVAQLSDTNKTLAWKTAEAQEQHRQRLIDLDAVNAQSRDLEAELEVHRAGLAEHKAREESLREERELVNAALAATDSAMLSLREKLKAASKVQRLSQKLGTLSAPKGAEHLREARTDFVLFAELQAAQKALQASWNEVSNVQSDIESVRNAVQDRVQGAAWLKKELASLKSDLAHSHRQAEKLEKDRWTAQAALEEREALVVILEDDLRKLEDDLGETKTLAETSRFKLESLTPDLQGLQREFKEARKAIAEREEANARLEQELQAAEAKRKEESDRRRQLEGEALRALEQTDRELTAERTARKEHQTARFFLRSKIDQLQKALHRDQSS